MLEGIATNAIIVGAYGDVPPLGAVIAEHQELVARRPRPGPGPGATRDRERVWELRA